MKQIKILRNSSLIALEYQINYQINFFMSQTKGTVTDVYVVFGLFTYYALITFEIEK
jgi:hypothetical protein